MRMQRAGWVGIVAVMMTLGAGPASGQVRFRSPQPGEIYRDFIHSMNDGSTDFVVVDPNLDLTRYPQAAPSVPPPQIPITISDLQGAIRAEATITFWGGHVSTIGQQVRFNSNPYINIPLPDSSNGIPFPHKGYNYLFMHMVTVDLPLSQLFEGTNYFQGMSGTQVRQPPNGDGYGFDWGQWGWYAMIIRVYYGPGKAHAGGQITSPTVGATMTDNPTVTASITSGTANRVEFLAYYEDYDTDGDGRYLEYHHDYMIEKYQTDVVIKNHVGTATSSPWSVTWNTSWVPDQAAGIIKMVARIRDNNNVCYVTPEVVNLSLARIGKSVKIYKPLDTPERCWAKGDVGIQTIHVNIPGSDNTANATAARYHMRTWNGANVVTEPGDTEYRNLNGWTDAKFGADHHFSYDVRTVPPNVVQSGTNTFEWYTTNYLHHAIEILWPGPALSVEYTGNYASPVPALTLLASPPNNANNQQPTLTLRWHPAATASTYDLQVSTDSLFGTIAVNLTNLADTSAQVGPLANMTKYFWRVRAKNAAGTAGYSTVWSFNTFLGAPALKSPANNALSQPVALVLVWNSISTASAYRLQVARDAAFSAGQMVRDTILTDTTNAFTALSYNTQFYWHVAAQIGGLWGSYSSSWTFTTAIVPAGVPALQSPANNALDQLTTLSVRWRSAAGAESYYLQVGTDPTFAGTLLVNDSTMTDTVRALSGLPYDTKYYWHVRSKNSIGASAFSPTWNFRTVMSVPVGPLLMSPANGTAGQPTTGLNFTWRGIPSATHYRFQLATDSTFASGIIKNDSTVVDTFRVVNGLATLTKYFWRVSGRNAGGAGPFSSTWSFFTYIPVPVAVSLVVPPQLAVIGADSAVFRWNKTSPTASKYWFQIAVDSLFSLFSATDSLLTDTVKTFRPLVNGSTYFWRVRGGNAGGWGDYSQIWRFNVIITGIAEEHGVPADFTLRQNFPNPFNPSTEISFGLPRESRVRLEVYNLLGQQVAMLVDEVRSAGFHRVRFDAAGLPSGMYLYRLSAGDVTLFRKMLFLK